jgi:predicted nucleic acid-binding protein
MDDSYRPHVSAGAAGVLRGGGAKVKAAVEVATAREVVRSYSSWVTAPTDVDTILRASEIAEVAQISFWDGMILAAAERSRAATLFTEDLNDGQVIAGIRIVNPLL